MSTIRIDDSRTAAERSVFAGLAPEAQAHAQQHSSRALNSTMPILLVGTMAMTMNLTAQVEEVSPATPTKPGSTGADRLAAASSGLKVAAQPAPHGRFRKGARADMGAQSARRQAP